MPASPTLPRAGRGDDLDHNAYLRLTACSQCSGRRRILVEVAGEVRGRCLECGGDLPVPLGTERHGRRLIVGRGGQGIVEIDERLP